MKIANDKLNLIGHFAWTKLFCLVVLILGSNLQTYSQSRSVTSPDRVAITKKKLVITRSGQFLRHRPDKRTAVIYYPFISGLRDPAVLRRVRSLLNVANVSGLSLREHRENFWLDELDYEVNHNANHILDITFTSQGEGPYPASHSRTIPIDLKTGRILKARDVFVEDRFDELAASVEVRLKLEVAELIKTAKENIPDADNVIELLVKQKFEVKNLDDFSISQEGVKFLYDPDFPHVYVGFEPLGGYLIPYSSLKSFIKATGPLAQFVK